MKPICDISKCDDNMHFIAGKAYRLLCDEGRVKDAEKMWDKFWKAGMPENKMEVLKEFVEVRNGR